MVITNFKCYICEKFKGERHRNTTVKVGALQFPVCDTCAEDIAKRHSVDNEVTAVLEKLDLDGMADNFMTQDGWGYCAQFVNWLYYLDDQGFRRSEDYGTLQKASDHFQSLYDDGWGYSDDDLVIVQERGYTDVYEGHKRVLHLENSSCENPLRRAKAFCSVHMRKTGFYPNVWEQNERGSIRRVTVR